MAKKQSSKAPTKRKPDVGEMRFSEVIALLSAAFRTGGGGPSDFDHSTFFNESGADVDETGTKVRGSQNGGTPYNLAVLAAPLADTKGVWVARTAANKTPDSITVYVKKGASTKDVTFNTTSGWFGHVSVHVLPNYFVARAVAVGSNNAVTKMETKQSANF